MKYKAGNRVRIKSFDWYNENKDEHGNIDISHDFIFYAPRSKYCGRVFTIDVVFDNCYTVKEDNHEYYWADEMFEGLVQDENNHLTETVVNYVKESNDRYRIVIDPRFDIEVDEGEYYAVRRKKEYPKTYEECCKILGDVTAACWSGYKCGVLGALNKLLICRDAYWKLYGEEMGLGKPWEPDWTYNGATKYCIGVSENEIQNFSSSVAQYILAFPTEEMRDAFKENFDTDIEFCKELL